MQLHRLPNGTWINAADVKGIEPKWEWAVMPSGHAQSTYFFVSFLNESGRVLAKIKCESPEEGTALADSVAEKVNALTKSPEPSVQEIGRVVRPALLKINCATGEVQPVPAHQARVHEEKLELDSRLERLARFIDRSPLFEGLPEAERDRLREQRRIMGDYSALLGQRIAAF